MSVVVRKLRVSDFFKLHQSYNSLGSKKFFIDLYWLGFERLSLKWLGAQIALFGSTIPLFRKLLYLIYPYGVFLSVVAVIDGEIVGHDFLIIREKLRDSSFMVEHGIWVTQKSRGLGVGDKLMTACMNFASEEGNISKFMLWVWGNNERALNLYKKYDLKKTKVLKDDKEYDGKKYDAIQMVCDINKPSDKKVLFISNGIDDEKPGITGGETRFMEVAKGWRDLGYAINLLSTKGGSHLCEKFNLDVFPHVIKAKSKGRFGFLVRLVSSFSLPRSLRGFMRGIVYSTNEQLYDVLPGLILKLKNPRDITWAVVVHWLPPYKWWVRKRSNFINSFLFLVSERTSLYLACLFADRILAVSTSTKDQIKNDFFARFFIKKVSTVECGVNYSEIRRVSEGVNERKCEAVFMKRLQAVKGVFDLVKIWKEVIKELPNAKLVVIGSGIDGEEVKKEVKDQDLEKNIIFTGSIFDFDKKIVEVSSAKLFILPSYEENWGIVIGESMACGTPVLAYGLKEYEDVWEDKFISIPVGNTREFAKKIVNLLENPEYLKDVSSRALEFVKKYDWKLISQKELKIVKGS